MFLQPAEEVGRGARLMLEDGLYTRFPRPTHAIALHDAANLEAGKIGYTPGFALANVASVDLLVRGAGGPGAYPRSEERPGGKEWVRQCRSRRLPSHQKNKEHTRTHRDTKSDTQRRK